MRTVLQLVYLRCQLDERISNIARELFTYCVQAGHLDELVARCRQRHPQVDW